MFNSSKDNYKILEKKHGSVLNELAMANKAIDNYTKEVDSYKSTVETMALKHSVEIEELKIKLQRTEKSVNAKINCALNSVGVTNFAIETISTSTVSPNEALSKFMQLTGGSKTEYYNENKEIITQALASQKLNLS